MTLEINIAADMAQTHLDTGATNTPVPICTGKLRNQ